MKKRCMAMAMALMLALPLVGCDEEIGVIEPPQAEIAETVTAEYDFAPEDYDLSGFCGDNAQWGFKETDGELVITGTGKVEDYDQNHPAPWAELPVCTATITGVSNIGSWAFSGQMELTAVDIPDTVTAIGEGAFFGCFKLECVVVPDGVTSIEAQTFNNCCGMTSLTLPDTVTVIEKEAICFCDRLTDLYYGGTEEQWNNIAIQPYNYLDDTTIHFRS